MSNVTQLLSRIDRGDPSASRELLPLVYEELKAMAAAKLAKEKPGHTLQATALVHEAYLRLVGPGATEHWNSRGHYFGAAAEAMRRILIDAARKKKRIKRGGDRQPLHVDDIQLAVDVPVDELLAVDELLDELAKVDQQTSALVKLRYFSGLSTEEAASVLQIPVRTAYRDWQFARAWLHDRIKGHRRGGIEQ